MQRQTVPPVVSRVTVTGVLKELETAVENLESIYNAMRESMLPVMVSDASKGPEDAPVISASTGIELVDAVRALTDRVGALSRRLTLDLDSLRV
jgi:hypothetical protein